MTCFMILLRGEGVDFSAFSQEAYQQLLANFESWNDQLKKAGRLVGSANLKASGAKTLRQQAGNVVIDGPYCETKEAIAGFFLIKAEGFDEAIELAKGCPFLLIGGSVEVLESPHVELEGIEV